MSTNSTLHHLHLPRHARRKIEQRRRTAVRVPCPPRALYCVAYHDAHCNMCSTQSKVCKRILFVGIAEMGLLTSNKYSKNGTINIVPNEFVSNRFSKCIVPGCSPLFKTQRGARTLSTIPDPGVSTHNYMSYTVPCSSTCYTQAAAVCRTCTRVCNLNRSRTIVWPVDC
jgi:hypothetical protein